MPAAVSPWPLARRYHVKRFSPEFDGVLLDLIIDYLTYVFIPAFALFKSGLMDGWTGWFAIIVITFVVKVLFWPLTHRSTVSMRKMQKVQPKAKAIQDKYFDFNVYGE